MDTALITTSPPRRSCARAWALAAVVVLALHTGPARAITWLCSLADDGTVLRCVADIDAGEHSSAAPVAAPMPSAVVNGTVFPLDPARVYTVPLWSPPTEAEFVQLLARATICYRSPGCAVMLAPSAWLGDAMSAAPAPPRDKARPKAPAS